MLKVKQHRFILALIQLGSIEAACKKVGITRPTYYEWLKNEVFVQKLQEQQELIYNNSIVDMKNLFIKAVENYENLLNSKNESIKFRTASSIINNINNINEIVEDKQNKIERERLIKKNKIDEGDIIKKQKSVFAKLEKIRIEKNKEIEERKRNNEYNDHDDWD